MKKLKSLNWPPENGRAFVRSEEFGQLLVEETAKLAHAYPKMDFVDAVATVFAWFARKLNRNAHFINSRRFPTLAKFKAYLRQSIFNAARIAYRSRSRGEPLSEIPPSQKIVREPKLTVAECEMLHHMVERLTEPHKSVFTRVFFDETDMVLVAGSMGLDEKSVVVIYEEAVDQLQLDAGRSASAS